VTVTEQQQWAGAPRVGPDLHAFSATQRPSASPGKPPGRMRKKQKKGDGRVPLHAAADGLESRPIRTSKGINHLEQDREGKKVSVGCRTRREGRGRSPIEICASGSLSFLLLSKHVSVPTVSQGVKTIC
jgi:hypothetical protein